MVDKGKSSNDLALNQSKISKSGQQPNSSGEIKSTKKQTADAELLDDSIALGRNKTVKEDTTISTRHPRDKAGYEMVRPLVANTNDDKSIAKPKSIPKPKEKETACPPFTCFIVFMIFLVACFAIGTITIYVSFVEPIEIPTTVVSAGGKANVDQLNKLQAIQSDNFQEEEHLLNNEEIFSNQHDISANCVNSRSVMFVLNLLLILCL